MHLDWALPLEVYAESIVTGQWPQLQVPDLNDALDAQLAVSRGLVAGFLRARGGLLSSIPKDAAGRGRAFPTPRSWDYAARLTAACQVAGCGPEVVRLLVHGVIGASTGHEFLAWIRSLDLPDPESVLADPSSVTFNGMRPDRIHVTLQSVLAAVTARSTPERWTAAMAACVTAANDAGVDPAPFPSYAPSCEERPARPARTYPWGCPSSSPRWPWLGCCRRERGDAQPPGTGPRPGPGRH